MWIKYYQDVEEKKAKQYDPEKLYAIFIVESIKYLSFWSGIESTIVDTYNFDAGQKHFLSNKTDKSRAFLKWKKCFNTLKAILLLSGAN